MKKSDQLKTGAVLSYAAMVINIVAGLLYTPWMVEQIGQSQYGIYTLANSLITMFMVDFGLSSATSRYVSKYRAENREDEINDFLGIVYKLYLIIDAVIFVALAAVYLFIDVIYVKLTPDELASFKVVYVIVAMYSCINFPFVTLNGILNAYERFIPLKLADIIYRVAVVLFTVAALLMGMGLYALVTVNALAGILMIVYKLVVIGKTTPVSVNFAFKDRSLLKDIFGFSSWVTVDSLAQRLVFSIVPTILGVVSNSAEIAVFGIVVTIESYTYLLANAINGMFMPKISRLLAENNSGESIMPLMNKVGRYQFAVNGLLVSGFALVGRSFIQLWMGDAYINAYYGIILVLVPSMLYNSMQIGNTAVVVTKNVKYRAFVSMAVGGTNVLLSFFASYYYGMLGACAAIFAAYMLRVVLLFVMYKRVLRLDMMQFAKKCYLRMSVPLLSSLVCGVVLNLLLKDGGWLVLGVKAVVIGVLYAVFVFVFGLTSEEKQGIISKIKRKVGSV